MLDRFDGMVVVEGGSMAGQHLRSVMGSVQVLGGT